MKIYCQNSCWTPAKRCHASEPACKARAPGKPQTRARAASISPVSGAMVSEPSVPPWSFVPDRFGSSKRGFQKGCFMVFGRCSIDRIGSKHRLLQVRPCRCCVVHRSNWLCQGPCSRDKTCSCTSPGLQRFVLQKCLASQ